MALRWLVYITGVAALVFSLGDFFGAQPAAQILGNQQLTPFVVGVVQLRGAVGLLYVFLAYFARYADENALRRVVGPTMLLGFVAQFVTILFLLLTGVYGSPAWIFIVLGIIFISAYTYLLYVKK